MLKELNAALTEAKRQVKRLENDFLHEMRGTIGNLTADSTETLVRAVLKTDLSRRLSNVFTTGPDVLTDRYRLWAEKYAIPLGGLESARDRAATQVSSYLKALGYE